MAATKEQRQAEIILNGTQVNSTLKQITQAASVLNAQLRGLPQGTKEFTDKAKELAAVRDNLARINNEVRSYQQVQSQANGVLGAMGNIAKQALASVAAFFAVDKAREFATTIDSSARAMIDLRREVQLLTKATGEELDKISIQVKTLADTFGIDFNEVIQSGNVLSKEFGTNFSDSLKVVETSLMNVSAVQRDEILSQMKEYSVQAKQAGLTIDQFAGVLIKSSNMGVFSDKGIDTIKEFGLRIREQTKATTDALSGAFGTQFTQKLFADLNSGSITTAQALEQVAGKLKTTGITAKQAQTVIADVFGGPGEDAGLPFIQSLANVTKGTAEATKETSQYSAEKKSVLELNKQLATAQNDLAKEYKDFAASVDTASKTFQVWLYQGIVAAIKNVKDFATFLYENSTALFALVSALIAYNGSIIAANVSLLANSAITKATNVLYYAGSIAVAAYTTVMGLLTSATARQNAVQFILNALMKANPIGLFITAVGALIGVVTYLSNSFSSFNGILKFFGDTFKLVFDVAVAIIRPFYGLMVNIFEGLGGLFQKLYAVARIVFFPIFALIEQMGDKFSPIMNILRVLYKAFETTFGDIGKVLKSILSLDVQGFFTNFGNYLLNFGKSSMAVFSQIAREIYRVFDAASVAQAEAQEKQRAELQKFADDTKNRIKKGEEDRANLEKARAERRKKQAEEERQEAKQKAQADSEAQKKAYEEAIKRNEEYNRKVLQAKQNLEDAKNELIQDEFEREIAQLDTQTARKIEAIQKEGVLVNEQIQVVYAQRDQTLQAIENKMLERQKANREKEKETLSKQLEEKIAIAEQELETSLSMIDRDAKLKEQALDTDFQIAKQFRESQLEELNGLDFEKQNENAEAEKEHQEAILNLRQLALSEKLRVLQDAGKLETEQAQEIANEILRIETEKNQRILEENRLKNEGLQIAQGEALQLAQDALQFGIDSERASADRRINTVKTEWDKKIETMRKGGKASNEAIAQAESERDAQIDAINKGRLARERQFRQIQSVFAIAEVVRNSIAEISQIWRAYATVPPVAAALTALAVGRAGLNVAKIKQSASQETFEKGGLLSGPSHAQGGIRGTGSFANVEVEGGEFINNAQSTANNLPTLRMINANPNTVFDVVPRTRFRDGGVLGGTTALPTVATSQNQASDMTALMMERFDVLIRATMENTEAIRQIKLSFPLLSLQEQLQELEARQSETTSQG